MELKKWLFEAIFLCFLDSYRLDGLCREGTILHRGLVPAHFLHDVHRRTSKPSEVRLRRRAQCSSLFLAVALAIALVGSILSAKAAPASGMSIAPDLRPLVPTVILRGIENGDLVGDIKGDVRLFLGDKQVLPTGSGAFRISAGVLRVDMQTITVPDGMRFVASKKGKRYYSVDAVQARNLAPKNRVYFRTADEAKAAGYR